MNRPLGVESDAERVVLENVSRVYADHGVPVKALDECH